MKRSKAIMKVNYSSPVPLRMLCALSLAAADALVFGQQAGAFCVIDGEDHSPLQYAAIQFDDTTNGTITNSDGFFSLPVVALFDSIRIAYVGYQTKVIAVTDLKATSVLNLTPCPTELVAVTVLPEDALQKRVIAAAEGLRAIPRTKAKLFLDMVSHEEDKPVEMIHAYYNAGLAQGRLDALELKHGHINIAPVHDRYFINLNTTRAFSLLDPLGLNSYFPISPLSYRSARRLERDFFAQRVSIGIGPQAVDRIRLTPRDSNGAKFTLELWLTSGTSQVRALELSCKACAAHPMRLAYPQNGISIDRVDLRYRQQWASDTSLPELIELDYTLELTSELSSEEIQTHAVMHVFDHGDEFILPLIAMGSEMNDYQRITGLPDDPTFWRHNSPPLITERQQCDQDYMALHGSSPGEAFLEGTLKRSTTCDLRWWSSTRGTALTDLGSDPFVRKRIAGRPNSSLVRLLPYLYLDLDTIEGQLLYHSRTALDAKASYYALPREPWTNAFINIFFDLCEVARREMDDRLATPDLALAEAQNIHAESTAKLNALAREFMKATRYGTDLEALRSWNSKVYNALGIDELGPERN